MKTDEQLKQQVEETFFSSKAHAEYMLDPKGFLLCRLAELWYMVLKLSQPADIQPLRMRYEVCDHGKTDIEYPATGYDMQDKINEIIHYLNNYKED